MKKLLPILLLLTTPCFAQVTAGYHRIAQVISRGNSGVAANVVPSASVFVANTSNGLAATIYSDPLLTLPIIGAILTTDSDGNYDYYLALNTCVTENISSPSQGTIVLPNVCGNSGVALPLATANGGTGATNAPLAGQLPVGQSGYVYAPETLIGDCTIASTGVMTCLKTNGTPFTSAATTAIGTSGSTIPLLSGLNTFSQDQTIQSSSSSETQLTINNTTSKSWSLQSGGGGSSSAGLFSIRDNTDSVAPITFSSVVISASVPMNIQGSPVCTSTNGVCATGSGTVTNFSTGTWPSWLTPSVSNPTVAPVLSVASSAIPNSALANPTFTINTTTTCTLGANCNLPGTSRSCNANGCYTKAADGTIDEWGTITVPASYTSYNTASVTFPFPFTTTPSVTVTGVGLPSSTDDPTTPAGIELQSRSTTGAVAYMARVVVAGAGGGNFTQTMYLDWHAKGY